MTGRLLLRGMLAGLAAAAIALVVAWALGEPQVEAAIAFEEQQTEAAGADHEHEEEPVSRLLQQTLGLATAVGVYGVAVGGLFALAFAFCYGRIGRFGARATSLLVALGAFTAVVLVPFLKYPANPPAFGDPGTIGQRTVLYFAMVALGLFAAIAAVQIGRRLAARFGNHNAALLGAAAFVALVAACYVVMPGLDEAPEGFPAELLWRFRMSSLAMHAALWAALGVAFGALAERLLRDRAPGVPQLR